MNENSVKVRVSYDFKTLKYARIYMLKYKKKIYITYAILGLIVLGLTTLLIVKGIKAGNLSNSYAFIAVSVLMAAYLVYQVLTIEQTVDKGLERYFVNKKVTVQELCITNENISVVRENNSGEPIVIDWASIQEIHEIPQYYFLFIPQSLIIIPKDESAFVEGMLADLKGIIADQASHKPYRLVDKEIAKRPITFVHTYVEEVNEANEAEVVEEDTKEEVKENDLPEEKENKEE